MTDSPLAVTRVRRSARRIAGNTTQPGEARMGARAVLVRFTPYIAKKAIKSTVRAVKPDVEGMFRFARWLQRHHDDAAAARAYRKAYAMTLNPRHLRHLRNVQPYQFAAQRELAKIDKADVHDPLFACRLERAKPSNPKLDRSDGSFRAEFEFRGLLITGELAPEKGQGGKTTPGSVQILLDGHVIQEITPVRAPSHRGESSNYLITFRVKRPVLDCFPAVSKLEVQSASGRPLRTGKADSLKVEIPHGDGSIWQWIAQRGRIEKKGTFPPAPEEVRQRQQQYLELYSRARAVFDADIGRSLFLMYGTLLGLYRDGDFIPGDDDFDIGYVSELDDPVAVKEETKEIIRKLVRRGFGVRSNLVGKLFRLHWGEAYGGVHLDARPVWQQDGKVWAHKQACLAMNLSGFREVREVSFRDHNVYVPRGTERFLAAYYGQGWRTPDPSYSNSSQGVKKRVRKNLRQAYLTPAEQCDLKQSLDAEAATTPGMGAFVPMAQYPLYPLERYERNCSWA